MKKILAGIILGIGVALGLSAVAQIGGGIYQGNIFNRIFLADGTTAAPSLSFSSDTNTGIASPNPDELTISTGGTARWRTTNTFHGSSVALGFGGASTTPDTYLNRQGSNSIGLGNSTSATNGTLRVSNIQSGAGVSFNFGASAGNDFQIPVSGGHLYPLTDNTQDLGNNGGNQFRTLYTKTQVYSPKYRTSGTAPTISACGTSPSVSGGDSGFRITTGTGVFTTCVVNFGATWTTAPACSIGSENDGDIVATTTATAITIGRAAGGNLSVSRVLMVVCIGV